MRILVISKSVAKTGGLEKHVRGMCAELSKRGHTVYVLSGDSYPGLRCVSVGTGRRLSSLWFLIFGLFRALRLQKRIGFHIIHAHDPYSGLIAYLVSRIFRIPFVFTAHTLWSAQELREMGSGLLASTFFFALSKISSRKADTTIVWSKRLLRRAEVIYGPLNARLLPQPIRVERFHPISAKEARHRLSLPEDKLILLFVGRLAPQKRVDTLLRALASLDRRALSRLLVVIVGSGPDMGRLVSLSKSLSLEGIVRFEGEVPEAELPYYYAACDALVLPSIAETFPLVILEAMSAGKPVIATSVGGIPDIVDDSVGKLVPPGDVESLARAVGFLVAHPSWLEGKSAPCRERALSHGWPSFIDGLLGLYYELIAMKRHKL